MKIVCIADTHNQHGLILPDDLKGDMIIHAGDVTSMGSKYDVEGFLYWFNKLPFKHKIFIAGNHDWFFEIAPQDEIDSLLKRYPDIIYLNDSGVEIEGLKIWGSPISPWFYNWAFNRLGDTIQPHWDLIPLDTNILITHGPIRGYLDMTTGGDITGCPRLLSKIYELPKLKLHVCGHIHEGHGIRKFKRGVNFVNASVLDDNYFMTYPPIKIIIKQKLGN